MYSHLLGRTTSLTLKGRHAAKIPFRTRHTCQEGVSEQIDLGPFHDRKYYVIENPHVLSLYKDRVTLAQLFQRYRNWGNFKQHGSGNNRTYEWAYQLPPLSEAIKYPDRIPKIIEHIKFFPPRWHPYTEEEWRRIFVKQVINKNKPLKRQTVMDLLDEIDRVRNQECVTKKDVERDRKAQRKGWDTEMQLYPEEKDALFSALPSAPESHEDDWDSIFQEELTEDFVDEFVDFFLNSEFVDPCKARFDHVQWQEHLDKSTPNNWKGSKKRWRQQNRKKMKEQFRGGKVDSDYLVYNHTESRKNGWPWTKAWRV